MNYPFNPVPPRIGGLGGNRLNGQIPKLNALTPNPSPNFGRGVKKTEKILIFTKYPVIIAPLYLMLPSEKPCTIPHHQVVKTLARF
jgi:hypothetical protein